MKNVYEEDGVKIAFPHKFPEDHAADRGSVKTDSESSARYRFQHGGTDVTVARDIFCCWNTHIINNTYITYRITLLTILILIA